MRSVPSSFECDRILQLSYTRDNHPTCSGSPGGVHFDLVINNECAEFGRITWNKRDVNEADCVTPKGFAVRVPQVYVDLYTDAGDQVGNLAARYL